MLKNEEIKLKITKNKTRNEMNSLNGQNLQNERAIYCMSERYTPLNTRNNTKYWQQCIKLTVH